MHFPLSLPPNVDSDSGSGWCGVRDNEVFAVGSAQIKIKLSLMEEGAKLVICGDQVGECVM